MTYEQLVFWLRGYLVNSTSLTEDEVDLIKNELNLCPPYKNAQVVYNPGWISSSGLAQKKLEPNGSP